MSHTAPKCLQIICQRGVQSHTTTSTHHEQVSQRRSDHRTNDTRSTTASVTETVSVQITLPATRSNIASVGAGMSHCNWTHSSRHQHYAMPEQFYRCALRRTFLLFSTAWLADRRCLPQRDRNLALSRCVTAKLIVINGVFAFQSALTNRYQHLQVLSLSFRCLHSLCRTVGGQPSPRKPRRGAGRLSTTPDTNIYDCNNGNLIHATT